MSTVLRQAVLPSWDTIESDADKKDLRTQELLEYVCRASSPLNPAQKRAAVRFLQKKGLCLIQGPLGCGKTTTTVT
ncbi:hypothetical protein BC936DRAFT_136908 [Jimgerdemannia flammicorona]|uniref:DNA2/NAM7 helicase helicase domain-containing protein n=1 Tax=Jimgerdemannia flammicorona TaxID=994334 RepID=A0A433CYI4_9FUNG|nr:hypothetical protein BC936DRAFT_136908 [Jimgerdemannia flammicorona]